MLPAHLLALTIAQKTSRHPACKWTQRLTGGKSSRRHSSALKHGQMASFRRSMAQSPIDGACDDDDDDHYYILLLSLLQFWVWLFIISIIMIMGSRRFKDAMLHQQLCGVTKQPLKSPSGQATSRNRRTCNPSWGGKWVLNPLRRRSSSPMEDVPAWVIFSENPEGLIAEIELQGSLTLMETHLCDGKVMSCQIPWYSMW